MVADTDATADQNGFDVVFILSTDIELGTIYFDFNIADFDNKRLFFIFSNFKIAFSLKFYSSFQSSGNCWLSEFCLCIQPYFGPVCQFDFEFSTSGDFESVYQVCSRNVG